MSKTTNKEMQNFVNNLRIEANEKYEFIQEIIESTDISIKDKELMIQDQIVNMTVKEKSHVIDNVKVFKYLYNNINNGFASYRTQIISSSTLKVLDYIEKKNAHDLTLVLIRSLADFSFNKAEHEIPYTNLTCFIKNDIIKTYEMKWESKKDDKPIHEIIHLYLSILEELKQASIVLKKGSRYTKKYVVLRDEFFTSINKISISELNIPKVHISKPEVGAKLCKNTIYDHDKGSYLSLKNHTELFYSEDIKENLEYIEKMEYQIDNTYLHYLEKYEQKIIEMISIEVLGKNIFEEDIDFYTYKTKFNTFISKTTLFLEGVKLAKIFKNETLYFQPYLDFRGRLYYYGYPVSPMSAKILRNLIMFKDERVSVKLDATASAFQIFGLLLRNENYLRLTNVLSSNEDIYIHYLNKLKEKNIGCEYIQSFDRAFFKNIMMCFAYNETSFGRYNKVKSLVLKEAEKKYVTMQKSGESEYFNKSFNTFKENKETIKKVSDNLNEFLFEEFKDIKEFNDVIKHLTKKHDRNTKFSLINNKDFTSRQFYVEQVSKSTVFKSYTTKKSVKITLKYDKTPLKTDTKKSNLSTMPNLVHSIDAMILHKVVKFFKSKNIPIKTTHDCFTVPVKYESTLQQAYKKSLVEVYEMNMLKQFIYSHVKDDVTTEYVKKVESKRIDISEFKDQILKYDD